MKFVKAFNLNWLPQNIAFNSDISRHYYELQLRDLDNPYGDSDIPLSVAKEFLWNRDFSLRWDLTRNLKLSFTSATRAEIEEPAGPVNKNLYPDEYTAWKDSIKTSLLNLGRPLDFQQSFNSSYKLPFDMIPIFDWVSSDVNLHLRIPGIAVPISLTELPLVNTIANQRSIDCKQPVQFRESLYNKIPFLRETNRLFSSMSISAPGRKEDLMKKPNKFERENSVEKGYYRNSFSRTKNQIVKVRAITQDGKRYFIKYKVLDSNKILVSNRDSIKIKLSIVPGPKPEEQGWYKIAQHAARFAMMARNISITYRNTYAMTLPGYLPEVGDVLGQKRAGGMFAPGTGFCFWCNRVIVIYRKLQRITGC